MASQRQSDKMFVVVKVSIISLLVATGVLKLVTCVSEVPMLGIESTVLAPLTVRQVVGLAALLELGVASFMVVSRSLLLCGVAGLWFSTVLVIYRLSREFLNAGEPCHCLGSLSKWLGLSDRSADRLSLIVAAYVLAASCLLAGSWRRRKRVRLALPGSAVLVFMAILLQAEQAAAREVVTFWGTISNAFCLPNGIHEEGRSFRVTVDGAECSFDTTNQAAGGDSHAAFKGQEYSYYYHGLYTNELGVVTKPIAARIELRAVPRDDGSWINYLWLAFACHSYFVSRPDSNALPIWATGLKATWETNMRTTALYMPLGGSPFPKEVDYISDGADYFEGRTAGLLQRRPLLPPLDVGYTNFVLRTLEVTNIDGQLLPVESEICRFVPVRGGESRGSLRTLVTSHIIVNTLAVGPGKVVHPTFSGSAVVLDGRFVNSTSPIRVLHLPMTNGAWPSLDTARKQFDAQRRMLAKAKSLQAGNKWRRRIVLACFALVLSAPVAAAFWLRKQGTKTL